MADNKNASGTDRRTGGRRADDLPSGDRPGGDRRTGGRRQSADQGADQSANQSANKGINPPSYSRYDESQLVETVVLYKKEEERQRQLNRRKRKDWVTWMSTIMTLVAWVIIIAVWAVIEVAAPEVEWAFLAGFWRVHFDMEPVLRTNWDYALIYIAFFLLIASIIMSAVALLFNFLRKRRKTDKVKVSIIVTGGISLIALVFFMLNFWNALF
jgi:cation transport ATPase